MLVLTEWSEFVALDPANLSEVVARRNIIDGRGALDPARWRAAGWTYRALGVATGPDGLASSRHEAKHPG